MNLRQGWKVMAGLAAAFLACFYLPVGWPRFDNAVLEAFHLSLKGTERSGQSCNGYKKVHSKRSFFDDLDVWQAQKLPQALSKLGHQRALLLQYASGGISSRTECDFHKFGLSIGNVTSDWPEWNILKSKKQDT